jgi:hypothetical protein
VNCSVCGSLSHTLWAWHFDIEDRSSYCTFLCFDILSGRHCTVDEFAERDVVLWKVIMFPDMYRFGRIDDIGVVEEDSDSTRRRYHLSGAIV